VVVIIGKKEIECENYWIINEREMHGKLWIDDDYLMFCSSSSSVVDHLGHAEEVRIAMNSHRKTNDGDGVVRCCLLVLNYVTVKLLYLRTFSYHQTRLKTRDEQ
jgi:hypothetical protein